MGYGDDIMATGMAKGFAQEGKLAAFGDGAHIIWGPWSEEVFRNNPNIARPDQNKQGNLVWIDHYKGHRHYNRKRPGGWDWDYNFRVERGELYLSNQEIDYALGCGDNYVVIEPNAKKTAINKLWPFDRYVEITKKLKQLGYEVVQFDYKGTPRLPGARLLYTPTFRHAAAALSRAQLYIGPEGGLHHTAAAFSVRAVVIFGGFIDPQITGYSDHVNLFRGPACGTWPEACPHCKEAMGQISVEEVFSSAFRVLRSPACRQDTKYSQNGLTNTHGPRERSSGSSRGAHISIS